MEGTHGLQNLTGHIARIGWIAISEEDAERFSPRWARVSPRRSVPEFSGQLNKSSSRSHHAIATSEIGNFQ
jgi:hypothetical protein